MSIVDSLYFLVIGKKWPIVFGLGAGFGMGLANCQHAFKDPHLRKMQNYKVGI